MATAISKPESPIPWNVKRQGIKHAVLIPIIYTEWLMERLVIVLRRWALIDLLEYAGRFSVVVAVFVFIFGHGDRLKEKHYQAWQVINAAQGKPGTGGRIDALQDLNNDGVSLAGVDLSGGAHLPSINLAGADLLGAIMDGAHLKQADLSDTRLVSADLSSADLREADLRGSELDGANLEKANLNRADLRGATIVAGASLRGAILSGADLREASLWEAVLDSVDLMGADLSTTFFLTRKQLLSAADWRGADLPDYLEGLELSENSSPEDVVQLKRREALETP